MRSLNNDGVFKFPLFIGALGAPVVYVAYGVAHAGARAWDSPIVIATAFGSAYLFSLALTAFCLAIASLFIKSGALRRRVIMVGAACVISFALFSAVVGGTFAGMLSLA